MGVGAQGNSCNHKSGPEGSRRVQAVGVRPGADDVQMSEHISSTGAIFVNSDQ